MNIQTKADWIKLAKLTIPKLPAYMAEFGATETEVETELTGLLETQNWKSLRKRFHEIWNWLPDNSSIRHAPFFDLCDLCSEDWVWVFVNEPD